MVRHGSRAVLEARGLLTFCLPTACRMVAGLRPEVIRARCARKTYGVDFCRPWSACDAETKREVFIHEEKGTQYTRGIFYTFITSGTAAALARLTCACHRAHMLLRCA